jgi:hypothetical protein
MQDHIVEAMEYGLGLSQQFVLLSRYFASSLTIFIRAIGYQAWWEIEVDCLRKCSCKCLLEKEIHAQI